MARIILVYICLVVNIWSADGQKDTVRLRNPSFEDTPRRGGDARNVIKDWFDCGSINFPLESPPDIHPNGYWENNLAASDKKTYLGLVVALALEAWSLGRARRAVAALMELAPPTARLKIQNGLEREGPAAEVRVGAHIIVRPGDKVPLDGRVAAGESEVNQAPITGESVPVFKGKDDEVFAGTINGEGALEIETTKAANDTTLDHIIRMVGSAQSRRALSENG